MGDNGDPRDWPDAMPRLRDLDAALRCSVCSELFTAPKLLPCGHVCAHPGLWLMCELGWPRLMLRSAFMARSRSMAVPASHQLVHEVLCACSLLAVHPKCRRRAAARDRLAALPGMPCAVGVVGTGDQDDTMSTVGDGRLWCGPVRAAAVR